jgi:hypothetical protein
LRGGVYSVAGVVASACFEQVLVRPDMPWWLWRETLPNRVAYETFVPFENLVGRVDVVFDSVTGVARRCCGSWHVTARADSQVER